MTLDQDKLSAFLDGELPETEAREIEAALAGDPALQAELESLVAADDWAKKHFEMIADEPVPQKLAAAIRDAPETGAANLPTAPSKRVRWMAAAAVLVAFAAGGSGGYFAGMSQGEQVAAAPGWLADIADYHSVYASQTRHLVEVPAAEIDHIRTWLSASVGDNVAVPDLSAHGLVFQGARLLVAAGKPVSQLMYTDAENRVVALCQIQTATPRDGFAELNLGGFDMVSWGGRMSNYVIVADENRGDLAEIARTASAQI